MKDIISKELLSEVLSKDIVEYSIHTGFIWFKYRNYASSINTYELVFRCKKWSEYKGYILLSKNKECLVYSVDEVYDVIECLNQYEEYFEADTELEAIFKACEWILKNAK